MCGINGVFSKSEISKIEQRIIKMNDSVLHRGPESGSYYLYQNKLAFGHRRLSIIDKHERSNQPMKTKSGVWHIVFNGEIYNFKEIKKELEYSFETHSDTEVIIAAVEEKGVEWFLNKSNGMFAIALFNSLTEELYLLRDRMGIKPLYYYQDDDKIVFSSEIKGILSSGLVEAEFNELAIDEYLGNRYVREPFTFFKSIKQVVSGCYLKINNKLNKEQIKYWDLPDEFNIDKEYNEENLLNDLDKELIKSINYRLRADVAVGTYLSGGVDSSMITAIASLIKNQPINTYTIGFNELNEFEYAQLIADKYNTIHHEMMIEKSDYVMNWERLIHYKDAPLGVPNEIPLALMSSELKKKITVVLSGEGADELMGGYGRIFRTPHDYFNRDSTLSFYDYFINQYEYVSRDMRDLFLNTEKNYREVFDDEIKSKFDTFSNEESVFRFFHKYHVKGLLQRVDMTTMQASVEARVPFLDHKLIEFVYSKVPYDLKLKWKGEKEKEKSKTMTSNEYSETLDTPKYLLRKLAYKYLPEEVVERKKVGFPVPLTEWFDNLEVLARKFLKEAYWLKEGVYEELIKKSRKEARSGQVLWMFINIEMFRKSYFEQKWIW